MCALGVDYIYLVPPLPRWNSYPLCLCVPPEDWRNEKEN